MTDVTNTAGDAVAAMAGGEAPVLEVTGLKKHFPIKTGLLSRSTKKVFAVDGVSFSLKQGETLGLVVGKWLWQDHGWPHRAAACRADRRQHQD